MTVRYRIIIGRREDFEGWGNRYRSQRSSRSYRGIGCWRANAILTGPRG